ncbi:PTS sugar transporter subunit IIA [Enterococcus sp. CSURQ0835]|uniref:PTS sugar transporter subunit IIA n=1 Tax=Enterococcus sp. CSURQ0835 TaxID=2681394 RepID=UPI001F178977|nr:PTS sugar transporter subunit IIA [Enterococcus sp. CSURQ0835]
MKKMKDELEEKKLSDYIKEPLIFVQADFKTSEELFEQLYHEAKSLGWVTDDFLERIKVREANFPTGLQLVNLGAAIPHTDAECVLNEFVAVITNGNKIPFKRMDDSNQIVESDVEFVLGLNQPHAQLAMLQSLMGVLQNESLLSELLLASTPQEVIEIFQRNDL